MSDAAFTPIRIGVSACLRQPGCVRPYGNEPWGAATRKECLDINYVECYIPAWAYEELIADVGFGHYPPRRERRPLLRLRNHGSYGPAERNHLPRTTASTGGKAHSFRIP